MPNFNPTTSNYLARTLASLHIPGRPLILTNVWDGASARAALSHPKTKAIATASFAIAAVAGVEDDDLSLEENLYAISKIASTIARSGKSETIPLTADLQNGYGEKLPEAIEAVIKLGVVGINLEDADIINGEKKLVDIEEQVKRINKVLEIAKGLGVPDFVVNARTDCVLLGGTIQEAISRGRRFLDAGAKNVFVWGGYQRGGLREAEVEELVKGLEGKLNVIYRKSVADALSIEAIEKLGVARISMGPGLWREGMAAVEKELDRVLGSSSNN
ncbi:carboxyphosphonoenolpyruvate phosphonomutase-like protein [Xylogone sp. PMI_703]|nr:carboxyphosphonoenolpyruvate phosphonomutase-like protein [Xylogone sp. PMI_703]